MSSSYIHKKKITIGFSPCPNDTFIFDALVHNKINQGDFEYEPIIEDVEVLNQMAVNGKLDVSKLSVHAYGHASAHYSILNSGAAIGHNCGPLLISKRSFSKNEMADKICAIPGQYTSALLLLKIFFPEIVKTKQMLFSKIEQALEDHICDLGLIIHESRFTFMERGFIPIADLGKLWYADTGLPLPLGIIAAHKRIDKKDQLKINDHIHRSIQLAFQNENPINDYIRSHAQSLSDKVIHQHIELYVNEFSLDLGPVGKSAIRFLLSRGAQQGLFKLPSHSIFTDEI